MGKRNRYESSSDSFDSRYERSSRLSRDRGGREDRSGRYAESRDRYFSSGSDNGNEGQIESQISNGGNTVSAQGAQEASI
ncbi:hypothetical protein TKK_0013874 [Trichogramma kaykai]